MAAVVYVLEAEHNAYPALVLDDDGRWRLEEATESSGVPDGWDPPVAVLYPAPAGPLPDFPRLAEFGPCFSERAVAALEPMLSGNGRLFPITALGSRFYVYHVDRSLAALDEEASEFERHPSGAVFLIKKHVFRPEAVADPAIFRLSVKHGSATYVTQSFVDAVKEHGLTGFRFFMVWDGAQPVSGSGFLGIGW